MVRQVTIVAHDPSWEEIFREEAERLRVIFKQEVIAIHHIGSTAIPGISAKPFIDILIEVRSINRIDHYNSMMQKEGYIPKGENGLPGRRFFIKGDEEHRTHHVHIYEKGHADVARHLDFRDYLRTHPDEASSYSALKQELVQKFSTDIDAYQEGKSELIKELEQKAAQWKKTEQT